MVGNPLAWSTCHKNDCPPLQVARYTCEALLWKNWWELKKSTKTSFIETIPRKLEKMRVHDNSAHSVKDSQSSLTQVLVASRSPLLSCPSMNKGQPTILTGFDQSMFSDIRRSNNAQLEMAIADFFHCETIADHVVESARFKNMLKQAQLVRGEFRPPTRKTLDVRNFYSLLLS